MTPLVLSLSASRGLFRRTGFSATLVYDRTSRKCRLRLSDIFNVNHVPCSAQKRVQTEVRQMYKYGTSLRIRSTPERTWERHITRTTSCSRAGYRGTIFVEIRFAFRFTFICCRPDPFGGRLVFGRSDLRAVRVPERQKSQATIFLFFRGHCPPTRIHIAGQRENGVRRIVSALSRIRPGLGDHESRDITYT